MNENLNIQMDTAIDEAILVLLELKKQSKNSLQSPLEIIKLVVCALDALLKAIVQWIPSSYVTLLKILNMIEHALSLACQFIPVVV